ncbi:hypothetical protein, partial [Mesorhizobium sp.]|uniref:hypothetical protein n=1 Tax=Mesorhizobium sp. TaxID=1871066 RepID=UPI002625CF57
LKPRAPCLRSPGCLRPDSPRRNILEQRLFAPNPVAAAGKIFLAPLSAKRGDSPNLPKLFELL